MESPSKSNVSVINTILAGSTICTISKQRQVHFTYIHNFLHKLGRTPSLSYALSVGEGRGEAVSLGLYFPLLFSFSFPEASNSLTHSLTPLSSSQGNMIALAATTSQPGLYELPCVTLHAVPFSAGWKSMSLC